MTDRTAPYIGRFAPSPTGSLHFGSLLAALASFLDARHHRGRWLLRIEDLDPPREQPGASDRIRNTLDAFGLEWDGEVRYQSQRLNHYQTAIDELLQRQIAYRCDCSRSLIAQRSSDAYDGHCRKRSTQAKEPTAVRVAIERSQSVAFRDRIQGKQRAELSAGADDFVIFRRDGFVAYQIAVVLDDAEQGVTNVVRGIDLLDSTPKQIWLQQQLQLPPVSYAHIPVLVNTAGQKLSKQTFACALDDQQPVSALFQALVLLGQQPDVTLRSASRDELLNWAISHWQIGQVPACAALPESELKAT